MKNLRKSLALLLAVCVMLSTVFVPSLAFAEESGIKTLYTQDFEKFDLKLDPIRNADIDKTDASSANYIYTGKAVISNQQQGDKIGSGNDVNNIDGWHGRIMNKYSAPYFVLKNAVNVKDNAENEALDAFKTEGANQNLYVDMDLRPVSGINGIHVMLADDASIGQGFSTGFQYFGYTLGGISFWSSEENGKVKIKTTEKLTWVNSKYGFGYNTTEYTCTADEWHNFRFVVHITDSEKAVGTYDIYMDNILLAENLPYIGGAGTSKNNIGGVVIATDNLSNVNHGELKVDNIYTYEGAEATASNADIRLVKKNAAELLLLAKQALDDGAIDETAYNGYVQNAATYSGVAYGTALKKSVAEGYISSIATDVAAINEALSQIAGESFSKILYNQDFENGNTITATGILASDITDATDLYTGTAVISNNIGDGSRVNNGNDTKSFNIGYYAKILKNYVYAQFPAKENCNLSNYSDVYVDADFRLDANSTNGQGAMHIMLTDDGATALSGASISRHFIPYAFADLYISSGGKAKLLTSYSLTESGGLIQAGGSKNYTAEINCETNSWHKVRFVLHKDTYDVYLDGELVWENISFPTGNYESRRNAFRTITAVADDENGSTAASLALGLDNIYVYKATKDKAPANYGAYQAKAALADKNIEIAKNAEQLNEQTYADYKEIVAAFYEDIAAAIKAGSGETGNLSETEAAVDEILAAIGDVSNLIPQGGEKYNETYANGSGYSDLYEIGGYRREYTTSSVAEIYPREDKEAMFSLSMKDAATVAKEGTNAGVIISFDLKLDKFRATGSNISIRLGDIIKGGKNWVDLRLKGSDGLFYYTGAQDKIEHSSDTYTAPVEDGKWYRCRLVVNLTNSDSTFNGKQSFYINGVPVFEDKYLGTLDWASFDELNGIKIIKELNETSGVSYGPMVCLDNIYVYKFNENSPAPDVSVSSTENDKLVALIRNSQILRDSSKLYDNETKAGKFTTEMNKAINKTNGVSAAYETFNWYLTSGNSIALNPDNKESYYINSLVLETADGSAAAEPVSGGKVTGVEITKNSAVYNADYVTVAKYIGGMFADAKKLAIPEMNNGETKILSFESAFENEAANADKISYKAYIWKQGELTPITGAEYRVSKAEKTGTKIFVIGDSTAANYNYDSANGTNYYPQQGFGQALSNFFDAEKITIDNRAISGYSTKSFIADGKWADCLKDMNPGDYVLICFGHNDQKSSTALHTDAMTSYKTNLEKFVKEAKQKGANPVVLSSVPRALGTGNTFVGVPDHMDYPDAAKAVAEEFDVPFIDLLTKVAEIIDDPEYGLVNARRDMYLFLDPNDARYADDAEYADSYYKEKGASDTTHLSIYGAQTVAKIICDTLKAENHPLSGYMKEFIPVKK